MAKQLKFWNVPPVNQSEMRGCTNYIAAYTKKQAIELQGKAAGMFTSDCKLPSYVETLFTQQANIGGWGNAMSDTEAITSIPCCFTVKDNPTTILKYTTID